MGEYNSIGLEGELCLESNYEKAFNFNKEKGGIVLDKENDVIISNKNGNEDVDFLHLRAKLLAQIS